MYKQFQILAILILSVFATASGREIKGTVLDGNGSPVGFANVALFRDSVCVCGDITDDTGRFTISTDTQDTLTAGISAVGYVTFKSPVPSSGDMGTILLASESVRLDEIVVKAARPATRLRGNALVTDVEGSLLATAGTAADVLTRIPMVIDNGGKPEVFGKGTPAIYINGRLVADTQELAQLNSGDIKNIELITNPGAAYAADVKSVVRIRTKPPKGDGWSGTMRTDNGASGYFRTGNTLDLKYRTRGLELFTNLGWWNGANRFDRTNDIKTSVPSGIHTQLCRTEGKESYNDMTGKIGFSWLISGNHSVGAYYQNSRNRHHLAGTMPSEIRRDGMPSERYDIDVDNNSTAMPRHYANIYYNGSAGRLGIDLNVDFLHYRNRETVDNDEKSTTGDNRTVSTSSTTRSRMFAEKLVLSLPVRNGGIEFGEEFTGSGMENAFNSNIAQTGNATTRTEERNIAAFVEFGQQFGPFNIGLGLRYEHITYNYTGTGTMADERNRTYNNLFPSLDISARLGNVAMALSYSGKTARPSYAQLDGTVSYINRFTYETGNPRLKPSSIQTVEYMAQWRGFFAQLSYTCFRNGVYHTTSPYGTDGEAILIKTANLSRRDYMRVFAGAQFRIGAWQPKINAGVMKQWLTLDVDGQPRGMGKPICMLQWQNALHLPFDIWLNADAQIMTGGWDNNTRLLNTPWTIDAKLYRSFFKDSFSITLEAKDIFNRNARDFLLCDNNVQIEQRNFSPGTSVQLTLQYRFNTSRDRYRGNSAGATEKTRF